MAYVNPGWINNSQPALDRDHLNDLSDAVQLLGVENGGTGRNSLTSGALLVGNGTAAVYEKTGTGALYATTVANPVFGTLPVSCGGTGASTVYGARSALGLQNAGFIISDTQPTETNFLWIDTGNGGVLKYYYNNAWNAIASVFAAATT